MNTELDCKAIRAVLPDLLFEPENVPATAKTHVQNCPPCLEEFTSMQATMGMLDEWKAPEPSPFWQARMAARLREEQAQPRRGWAGLMERVRTRLWLSNHTLRPAAGAAALGLILAVSGGTWLEMASQPQQNLVPQASNTVRDLQSLVDNAQVFQQMSSLDTADNPGANE